MTRPHPRTLAVAAVFVAGSLLLAACSNSSPASAAHTNTEAALASGTTSATAEAAVSPADPASAAATQATAAAESPTAPGASGGHLHACLLVSEQDATTALGADPGTGHEETQEGAFGGNSRCNYAITSAGVQVSASSIAGKALCDGNRQPNSVDVPGVGDRAFETPATSAQEATVYFLKGDICVSITIETPASMGSPKDRVIALATTAAGRL
jgi:hypothetical protein